MKNFRVNNFRKTKMNNNKHKFSFFQSVNSAIQFFILFRIPVCREFSVIHLMVHKSISLKRQISYKYLKTDRKDKWRCFWKIPKTVHVTISCLPQGLWLEWVYLYETKVLLRWHCPSFHCFIASHSKESSSINMSSTTGQVSALVGIWA